MNGLLAIAEGFLDKMTNPQYGSEVNDEYSVRFNHLLIADADFAGAFARLALGPEDVDSLPICAWPWYLQWRTEHGPPPSADFLDALFESTDDPAVRMSVMISALSGSGPDDSPGPEPSSPARPEPDPSGHDPDTAGGSYQDAAEEERIALSAAQADVDIPASRDETAALADRPRLRSGWLGTRLTQLASSPASPSFLAETSEIATYLLQLGDPQAVRELLELRWAGQADLREAIRVLLDDAGLDPQTLAQWHARLGLPAEASGGPGHSA
jgi:hypothetical protein